MATCRRQLGQKSLNMKRWELYAYAVVLIKQHALPNHVKFIFADVMCKLWKFLKKVDPSVVADMKGALPVMHAKSHSLDGQVG